jgi:hypothetical protein
MMTQANGMHRQGTCCLHASRVAAGMAGFIALTAVLPLAHAQMYTPDPRIDFDMATNTFFGSTKDTKGRFLSGVTAQFKAENVTYVMTTDDAGRFKVHVPKSIKPGKLVFSCSKPGYRQVSAIKRPPPGHATTPVQADCVLSPLKAAVQ